MVKIKLACSVICITAIAGLGTAQIQPAPAIAPDMPVVEGTVADPRDADEPASAAGTLSEADRTFVEQAAVSGLFEVQSSQLATTASQNQAVTSFARQMIQDHTAANQQLQQLATQKRVAVPSNLDAKHAEKLSKLASKQGDEFDKAYGKAQVKAHQEAIALFQRGANNAQDADLKQFAQQTLPKLQQHLQMAQQLPGADQAEKKQRNAQQPNSAQQPDTGATPPTSN